MFCGVVRELRRCHGHQSCAPKAACEARKPEAGLPEPRANVCGAQNGYRGDQLPGKACPYSQVVSEFSVSSDPEGLRRAC